VAEVTVDSLHGGLRTIRAHYLYGPDLDFNISEAPPIGVMVDKKPPMLELATSAAEVPYRAYVQNPNPNDPPLFALDVLDGPDGTGGAIGLATFTDIDSGQVLGSGPMYGGFSLDVHFLPAGLHHILASFTDPDGNYADATSDPVQVLVDRAPSDVGLGITPRV